MRILLPILILGLLLIAGLFLTLTLSGSVDGGSSRSDDGGYDAAELSLALRELREDNERILERLAALEERQLLIESTSSFLANERRSVELEEPPGELTEEEVSELVAALRGASQSPPEELEALVLGVIENKEAREEEERALMREQMRETRMDERMQRLAEELGLAEYQVEEMRAILTSADKRRGELFLTMQESGGFADRDQMRESMRELRDDVNEKLGTLLTPDQYERYQELDDERGFGMRGGRGGGGFGGGGGGGSDRRGR